MKTLLPVLLGLMLSATPLFSQGVFAERTVERVEFCAQSRDPYHCRSWQPYRRVEDLDGPIWFLISTTGLACEVDGFVAGKLHRLDLWPCVWRFKQ